MEYGYVLLWAVMFVTVSALGLPLTNALFSRLPGSGSGFAPAVSIGVVSLVAFWLGQVRFGPVVLIIGVAALVALSGLAVRAGAEIHWRAFGESMGVFAAAFGFMIAIYSVDPGILPFTEDFLDYGMMRAVLRAPQLPPEDFWFAGESVRYYYGGHLIAALETSVTGTPPPVAYNLAIAGFYATLVSGAYAMAGAVAASNSRSRRLGGIFGAYFVGFASNLLAPFTFLLWVIPDAVARPLAAFAAEKTAPQLGWFSEPNAVVYWTPSRVVEGTINEFPLFSWLHGELHAQMTSAPFFLVVAGLCFAYFRTPEEARGERRRLAFVAVPIAAGFAMLVDIWTAPSSLGLFWLTLAFSPAALGTLLPDRIRAPLTLVRGGTRESVKSRATFELLRFGGATALTAGMGFAVVLVAAPLLLIATGGSESVGFVASTERSTLLSLLLVHGGMVSVLVVFLGARVRSRQSGNVGSPFLVVVAFAALVVLSAVTNAMALLLVVPLLAVSWVLLRTDAGGYEVVLIAGGAGLVLVPEFVYLHGHEYLATRRMNTVFRAYLQAWVLWGVAVGGIVSTLVRVPETSPLSLPKRDALRTAFVCGLLVSTAVYGGVAAFNHFDRAFEEPDDRWEIQGYVYHAAYAQDGPNSPTQPPTLDGLLWAEVMYPNETAAVNWLDQNASGTPTIVSAPGGRWEWRSPAASLTGVPTVAGWGHELVYRDWDEYYSRVSDVQLIYTGTPEERVELLKQYDVQYVYVGRDERIRYDIWEFAVLNGVTVAYDRGERWNESVTIYRIDQSALAYAPTRFDGRRISPGDLSVNRSVADWREESLVANGSGGALAWYGPEMHLPPGAYEATFEIDVNATDNAAASEPRVTVDVVRGAKSRGMADFRVVGNESVGPTDGPRNVTVSFRLTRPATDVEFRGTLREGNGSVRLHGISVAPRSENVTKNVDAPRRG
ncbi:DUF2298 domain-containing protein [Halobellus sp. GM3]|uniref:DUF2298 domain-containing protein n=1 Tax=Halobellus sp. GM3 TaxID=3458410 RepID=UPI00403DF0DF